MFHNDLIVWKEGLNLVKKVYKLSSAFPQTEQFGLTSQLRRAVVSVPSNIAEGCGRNSDKELVHFCWIAMGSLSEVETQIIIAKRVGLCERYRRNYGGYLQFEKDSVRIYQLY